MGRSGSVSVALIAIVLVISILPGCGSGSGTTPFPTPAQVTIIPSNAVSLTLGETLSFAATTMFNGRPVTQPVQFHSTNTAVVTVANNGQACAGSWNSLTTPQVCTPGSAGIAQVTANAMGVSSTAVTIYVHQPIDNLTIAPIPPAPPTACLSKETTANYQVTAFARGVDITATVGQFTWQSAQTAVAGVSNTVSSLGNRINGVSLNQVQITAKTPGLTQLFASVGNTISAPFNLYTCPVKSVALEINGISGNSFTVAGSGSKTVTPTVTDANNTLITGIPLTWSSSSPNAGTASGSSTTGIGTITLSHPGTTAVVASCTPPTCNIGLTPADPVFPTGVIYAQSVITGTATPSGATEPAQTVWVSTTDCSLPQNAATQCATTLVPITSPANVVGNAALLPATPNSMVLSVVRGASTSSLTAFMGTDSSRQGTRGLIVANLASTTPTITQYPSVIGRVLAASPNGSKVIVSDTLDTPNLVYVFDTSSHTAVPLAITGAVAADFSPDSLKAFILANSGTGSTLYVYSLVDPLLTVPLSSTNIANDVSFLSQGSFAYIAGGDPNGVTVGRTCDAALVATAATPAAPTFIKTLPNATQVLGLAPPLLDVINVSANIAPPAGVNTGCFPAVTNAVQTFNLGQGAFTPLQLLIAPDSTKAYIVASNLPSIIKFDVINQISSAIPLSGNNVALRAALTLDGNLLYVAASDRMVHVLSTQSGGDIFDISFPATPTTPDYLCPNSPPVACRPNLIGIQP
ncbi:MAG TPA: Ig-like domain-containing protein [Terriglobales bacterium]|nr:Ig-like domain-containing protein [Terriglobales bacterium]